MARCARTAAEVMHTTSGRFTHGAKYVCGMPNPKKLYTWPALDAENALDQENAWKNKC